MRRQASIPPSTVVGRQRELTQIEESLEAVSVASIVGVAGVGKSTLLSSLGQRSTRKVLAYTVRPDDTLSLVVDDLRRILAAGPVRSLGSDDERLADLVDRLESDEVLLLIDDLHQLADAGQTLLTSLGGALETARVVSASRQRVLPGARDPLRYELTLRSLEHGEARQLWQLLDGLYGPRAGFDKAWDRSRGNPLLLKRAHAGELDGEDPIGAALEKLDDDERLLARALALSRIAVDRDLLIELVPNGRSVLRSLVTRLIVTVDGSGAATLHDLFRDAVLAAMSDDDRRRIHSVLADALMDTRVDLVIRTRSVCRHLAESRRYDDLARYALTQARRLVRHGAAAELAAALEALPASHRTLHTETLRARALARTLDLHRAFAVLESAIADGAEPEARLTFARVALLMGRLDLAEQTLEPLLGETADDEQAVRVAIAAALIAVHRNRGDDARRVLTDTERRISDPLGRAVLVGYRAFCHWLDESDADAGDVVARARALAAEGTAGGPSQRAQVSLPYGLAAVLGRAGRFAEAEELLEGSRRAAVVDEDVLLQLELRLVAGEMMLAKGERLAALAELEAARDGFTRGGYVLGALWTDVFRARALLSLGRRSAALRVIAEAERLARESGIEAILAALDRTRALDPVRTLQRPASSVPAVRRGDWLRAQSLEALRGAVEGDPDRVTRIETQLSDQLSGAGYGFDRALLALSKSVIAEARGDHHAAEAERRRALSEAEAEKVDAELLSTLVPSLGSLRIVSPEGRWVADSVDTDGWQAVIDARSHVLSVADKAISLKSRHVVRRLLYGFAREPGRFLNKERLAEAAWGVRYDPRVHDGALKVNLVRLRGLLKGTGLSVEYDVDGYRLQCPVPLLFVEPLDADRLSY